MASDERVIGAAQAAILAASSVSPATTIGELAIGIAALCGGIGNAECANDLAVGFATSLVQLVGVRSALELIERVGAAGGGARFS